MVLQINTLTVHAYLSTNMNGNVFYNCKNILLVKLELSGLNVDFLV